jgi:alpha-glucosidase
MKDPALPDLGDRFPPRGLAAPGHPHWDRDEVHEIYRRWRQVIDGYPGDRIFVAEAYLHDPARLALYLRADELHTAFNFDLLLAPWDARAFRSVIDKNLEAMRAVEAPPTWVLSNHDMVRHVTRYGGGEQGLRRARAAALVLLSLPGGAYVYQGEELGLPEVTDLPAEVRQDPTFHRTGGAEPGRDGCRVPLPWSGTAPSYGFSPDGASWLPQPAAWAELSRERQASEASSTLNLYREALRLRRELGVHEVELRWLEAGPDVLAYGLDDTLLCVVNMGDGPIELSSIVEGTPDVLLASAPFEGAQLPGATAVWVRPKKS